MPFGPGFALNFIQRIFFPFFTFHVKGLCNQLYFVGDTRQCNVVHNGFRKKFFLKVFVWDYFHILFYITSYTFLYIKFSLLLWPQNLSPWAMLLQSLRAGQNLWNLHFRSLSTRVYWPKIIFGLWRREKRELENNWKGSREDRSWWERHLMQLF